MFTGIYDPFIRALLTQRSSVREARLKPWICADSVLTATDTNFIQQKLPPGSVTGAGGPDGQSGALNMDQRASTGITTFNSFWQYFMPLFGAYVADQYC
jgi:hypothetical protein